MYLSYFNASSKSKFYLKSDRVNLATPASPIECPGDTLQIQTGNVDPARKFKCTTAARASTPHPSPTDNLSCIGHLISFVF